MKKIFTLFFALALVVQGFSQTYYSWNFATATTGTFPTGFVTWKLDGQSINTADFSANGQAIFNATGWVQLTQAQNGGVGVAAACSDFVSTTTAADRWLVTPRMTIPTATPNVALVWNAASGLGNYPDKYEVKISVTDSNSTSFTVTPLTITENGYNTNRVLPLAAYAGMNIRVAFRDITVSGYLLFINSIKLVNLPTIAASVNDVEIYEHNYLTNAVPVTGQMTNKGFDTIKTFTLNYSVNGATPVTSSATGAGLMPLQSYFYTHATPFNPSTAGTYLLKVWFSNMNGGSVNSDTSNITLFYYPKVNGLTKNVLLEEFTGAWCGYCPGGSLALRDLLASDPHAVGVAIHDQAGGTTADDAMQIPAGHTVTNTYQQGFPSTMVDRQYFFDNQIEAMGYGFYNNTPSVQNVDTAAVFRYNQATPVNVSLANKTYDTTTGALSVDVNADFLNSLSQGDYRLNLIITEDSIITTGAGYDQHNYYSTAGSNVDAGNSPLNALPSVITNDGAVGDWAQNHVLRAMLGGAWGSSAIIPSAPSAGSTYTTTFTTTIPSTWRSKFVKLIGVVQEYNSDINKRTVLNVTSSRLANVNTGIRETSQLNKLGVYPNPASTMATVEMDLRENATVVISIVNTLGETMTEPTSVLLNTGIHSVNIPVNTLAEGLYFVKVSVNGQTNSLPLSIAK